MGGVKALDSNNVMLIRVAPCVLGSINVMLIRVAPCLLGSKKVWC